MAKHNEEETTKDPVVGTNPSSLGEVGSNPSNETPKQDVQITGSSAKEKTTDEPSGKDKTVPEVALSQAVELQEFLTDNRKEVGSDIAQREFNASLGLIQQVIDSLGRAVRADR